MHTPVSLAREWSIQFDSYRQSFLRYCRLNMYEASDKIVLVTGGAAGIGAGIVQAFLDEGVKHAAALDIDISRGKILEKELTEKYGANKIRFHSCDVTTNELDAVYESVLEEFGYIDIVVNCAGIANESPNYFMKTIELNVSALIKSSFKAFNLMRKDYGGKGGTIINVSSVAGIMQTSFLPVYGATKSAVLQFSNSLGMEPNYTRSGVRVLAICFGRTDTTIFSPPKMAAFDKETEEILRSALPSFPMQKPESAVKGLIHAFKHGASASTWVVTSDRPAEDITEKITEAYNIMSQGVLN